MRNTMTCLLQCSVSNVFRQALINVKVSLKFSSISNKTCSWLWLKVLHPSSSFWVSWGIQLGSVQFFQVTQMYRRVLLKLHLNTSYNQVHTLKEEKKTWKKKPFNSFDKQIVSVDILWFDWNCCCIRLPITTSVWLHRSLSKWPSLNVLSLSHI